MINSNRPGRNNWSKCKRAAATLFILLFTPVLARAESIGASAKTWIEIKAADKAAEALANPNVTAKERLRVEQIYYQLVRDHPQSVPAQNALAAFLWKNGKVEAAVEHWRTDQRLEPKNGEAANSLDGAYLRIGRVPEAAEQFLLAVRSESNNPDYHFDLGNVEFVLRRDLTAAWKIDSAELLQRALFQISSSEPARTDGSRIRSRLRGNVLWDAEPRLERGASRLAALSRALHEPELRLLAARAGQPEATQES